MKGSLIILSFFVLGLLLSLFKILPDFIIENDYSTYALYLLMFVVGIGVGADKSSLKVVKQVSVKIIFVPLSAIIGSLLGTFVASYFIKDVNFIEAMAIGSGFGYYSLSSVTITKLAGSVLGVMALLSNIIREIVTLLLTPLMVKFFGKLAPISSGGATSMDTTLPIITKYSGKEYAVISVFNGIVLTIIVPFLVTFILSFM